MQEEPSDLHIWGPAQHKLHSLHQTTLQQAPHFHGNGCDILLEGTQSGFNGLPGHQEP